MAATDKPYRSQRTLDIVFGVTCVLMLASIVWMYAQDFYREFKVEQRDFRDVEEAVAQRQMLRLVPDQQKLKDIEAAENKLAEARQARASQSEDVDKQVKALLPAKVKKESEAQSYKADYDSIVSIYNIEIEKRNAAAPGSAAEKTLSERSAALLQKVQDLGKKLQVALGEVEEFNRQITQIKANIKDADKSVADAEDHLKELTADFDRFAKLAIQKKWKTGDWFRALPVLDAFASPTRIQQFTLSDLPIDYNFKHVTRYDRCTTCHLGIDRPAFDKQALLDLTKDPSSAETERLETGRAMLQKRRDILNDQQGDFQPANLQLTKLTSSELTAQRVNEYSAHPRLDLFAEGNSAHPAEKFGCSICHGGQGSATDFNLAAHTPDNFTQKTDWTDNDHWESSHFWDFPMLPKRFIESSCLKCHHQVTDLLPTWDSVEFRHGKKVEAPGAKVVRGYNLVREFGCFGCHEIAGIKGGRPVGPDMRLEPYPPLETMTPLERDKLIADPQNPPGTFRKVGPSLRRLSEKTNQEWVRRWIQAPRDFRPDTKMPHFYGLSNNRPEVLPDDQKKFPDTEIHAIAYYLFREGRDYLQGKDTYYLLNKDRQKNLQEKLKSGLISEAEHRELEEINHLVEIAKTPVPIANQLKDGDGKVVSLPEAPKDAKAGQDQIKTGRQLFSEKGCLACHSHSATTEKMADLPAIISEANFGPNLSQVAAKIAPEGGDADAQRRWLVQWIMNPTVHNSRTLMPITHLTAPEAASIAAWLLSQPAGEWNVQDPPAPTASDLENLAQVWLEKALGRQDSLDIIKEKGLPGGQEAYLRASRREADELRLAAARADESWEDKLKWYVGKKAISQLGCFGCHDIPGFEYAKPIGTPLNDWGKKDPERLAFEDVLAFVKGNYNFVDTQTDDKGFGHGPVNGKPAYEKFFLDALEHHQREGFLNQKLTEPRSYDFDRLRGWEDRLRMPQFKFGRKVKPLEGESPDQAQNREDAQAQEAVMTFILGLLAEPIPLKFVNDPLGDKLAEANGKKVLEKFNCAGCHQVEPGIYEFNTRSGSSIPKDVESRYNDVIADPNYLADLPDYTHNAWAGRPSPHADTLQVHGLKTKEAEDQIQMRLTQALRFIKKKDEASPDAAGDLKPGTYDIPAGEYIGLSNKELVSQTDPHGGAFVELLVPYLVERKPSPNLDDNPKARSGLPPPLAREGEKVQPGWLFQFLKDPFAIRKVTILRMPKFSLSDAEAMTLVSYFAAVSRRENPGIGLSYPYDAIPQRAEDYLIQHSQDYAAKLGPADLEKRVSQEQLQSLIWDRLLKERVTDLEEEIKAADKAVAAAPAADKKIAEKNRDQLKERLQKLTAESKLKDGPFRHELRQDWEKQRAYATDAFRLLTNPNTCLKCHQVGKWEANQPIGPALTLTADRLRPDWTERWIASPQRLLIYPDGLHPMPQNFLGNKREYQEYFQGGPREQVEAVRDILMNYSKVADMPENRYYVPIAGGGK